MTFAEWIRNILDALSVTSRLRDIQGSLLEQIKAVSKTDRMGNDFDSFTDEFIDRYSVRVINEILNTLLKDDDHARELNRILIAFLPMLRTLFFTSHSKFVTTAQKIFTERMPFFYIQTMRSNAFIFPSASSYFTSNVNQFIKSDLPRGCHLHFMANQPWPESICLMTCKFLNSFRER
jgi:hypothetical protein